MKEIKYRIFSKNSGKFCVPLHSWYFNVIKGEDGTFDSLGLFFQDEEDRFVIQMSTGLKDKTGKDIYEGDIIETFGYISKEVNPVYFNENEAGFGVSLSFGNFQPPTDCIVLGNVLQNPELLPKEEK